MSEELPIQEETIVTEVAEAVAEETQPKVKAKKSREVKNEEVEIKAEIVAEPIVDVAPILVKKSAKFTAPIPKRKTVSEEPIKKRTTFNGTVINSTSRKFY